MNTSVQNGYKKIGNTSLLVKVRLDLAVWSRLEGMYNDITNNFLAYGNLPDKTKHKD